MRDMGGGGGRIVDLNVVIHGGKKEVEEEEEEEEEEDVEEEGEEGNEEEGEEEEEEEEEDVEEEGEEGNEEEGEEEEEEELDSEDHSELEESGFELMEEQSGGEGEDNVGVGLVDYRDNISDEDFEKMLAGTLSPWGEVDLSHDRAGESHDHDDITTRSHDLADDKHGYNGKLIALILTPTRELALQVHSHITAAVKYTSVKVTHTSV